MVRQSDKITVIFPIGGKAERFNNQFKPFLKVRGKMFIELAIEPFLRHMDMIREFMFIYYQDQEKAYKVRQTIAGLFYERKRHYVQARGEWPFEIIFVPLPEYVDSACLAVVKGFSLTDSGQVIICDCDHSVNVDPIFDYLDSAKYLPDCIVPLWPLENESIKNWAVASVEDDAVTGIAEKAFPKTIGEFHGVIGCYYFKSLVLQALLKYKYFSEYVSQLIKANSEVVAVHITDAKFFGDPDRLNQLYKDSSKSTVFIDLDGVLIEHDPKGLEFKPISHSANKLREWYKSKYIIITTSRKDREKVIFSLDHYELPYHELITGLPSGPRYLVNDRKPSDPLTPMAVSLEITRNSGLSDLEPGDTLKIIKRFTSGSFADTLLISGKNLFVRKIAYKEQDSYFGYTKLKRQYHKMLTLSSVNQYIVPRLLGECENSLEYYYDIEYLQDHRPLNELNYVEILPEVIELLNSTLYSFSKQFTTSQGTDWLKWYINNKVLPRLSYAAEGDQKKWLAIYDKIKPFERWIIPNYSTTIHGDLTLENILYNPVTHDVKFIDAEWTGEQSNYEVPELDLGKLYQSLYSQYEQWKREADPEKTWMITIPQSEINLRITGDNELHTHFKGFFYLSTHLIRMLPFRLKVSEKQRDFAMSQAILWLNECYKLLKQ